MNSRKNRTLHQATVTHIEDITPRMRRIRVIGGGLHALPVAMPGQWMKIFFPAQPGEKPQGRAYTIRRFDSGAGAMEVDFVLHGDTGPASRWAGMARPGDIVQLAGPRAGYRIDPLASAQLLIGDATALPAIAAIVEALPEGVAAHVFAEVADQAEEQHFASRANLTVHWVHSDTEAPGTTGKLELAMQHATLPSSPQVWLAGESFMVRAILTHLLFDRGILHTSIDSAGYWKFGAADHRDADA
ncbi:MAG: siderophore-interacting protein [Sphingopyxis sp.]|nr:siderophore-interacting protein [Sphingopyxis sp.]